MPLSVKELKAPLQKIGRKACPSALLGLSKDPYIRSTLLLTVFVTTAFTRLSLMSSSPGNRDKWFGVSSFNEMTLRK